MFRGEVGERAAIRCGSIKDAVPNSRLGDPATVVRVTAGVLRMAAIITVDLRGADHLLITPEASVAAGAIARRDGAPGRSIARVAAHLNMRIRFE